MDLGAGVHLFSFEHGRGARALVLHGGPGLPTSGPWAGLQTLTSEFSFLYNYDQRGAGRSTRPFVRLPEAAPHERMQLLHRVLGLPSSSRVGLRVTPSSAESTLPHAWS